MEELFKRNKNGAPFLSGTENPMWIDIHVYPIAERMVMLEGGPWDAAFQTLDIKNKSPEVYSFVHAFREHPKMKPCVITKAAYDKQATAALAAEQKVPLTLAWVMGE